MLSWEYIAGFVDGEGYLGLLPYDNRKYGGRSHGIRGMVNFGQRTTHEKVIVSISGFLSQHDIHHSITRSKYPGHTPMTTIRISAKEHIGKLLTRLIPFMIVKRPEALQLIEFIKKGQQAYVT